LAFKLLSCQNDLKEEAESKVRQSQDAELATLLVRLIKTPVPYLESSDVRMIKTNSHQNQNKKQKQNLHLNLHQQHRQWRK